MGDTERETLLDVLRASRREGITAIRGMDVEALTNLLDLLRGGWDSSVRREDIAPAAWDAGWMVQEGYLPNWASLPVEQRAYLDGFACQVMLHALLVAGWREGV